MIVEICTGCSCVGQRTILGTRSVLRAVHTPHLALLALFPISYTETRLLRLFVECEGHVGRKLHRHSTYWPSATHSSLVPFHIPKGPLISTVFGNSVTAIPAFLFVRTLSIWSSTSAGIETGASPIRDLHPDELEKGLTGLAEAKAGTKKSGIICREL